MQSLNYNKGFIFRTKEIKQNSYEDFVGEMHMFMKKSENHIINYFAIPQKKGLQFFCFIANDLAHTVKVLSFSHNNISEPLSSLSAFYPSFHVFEREIIENYGVVFSENPYNKPLRYPEDRNNKSQKIFNFPFYKIEGEEVHEVGVGPVHAGIIEPGHFRFQCYGEKVLHLEIQLGYQHRGIEKLFIKYNDNLLKQTILSQSIAGDTAIGHSLAFVHLMETLGKVKSSKKLQYERTLGLELERIAVHTGDLAAMCVDVAYQLGANVLGVLRTPIVNFLQIWCGNRLGKNFIRVGGSAFPFSKTLAVNLLKILDNYEKRFESIAQKLIHLPSLQSRFFNCGGLSSKIAQQIGAVGMAARATGLLRDIRKSHPFDYYCNQPYIPDIRKKGDVGGRVILRIYEIQKSIKYIRKMIKKFNAFEKEDISPPLTRLRYTKNRMAFSLIEGWRGEICHFAVTDKNGDLIFYKIKDPSLHNWYALCLSMRNEGISDFPINNKSYNLSYCGHDL